MIRARFFVLGTPAPQGSKRIVQPKGHRRPLLLETSKRLGPWRKAVAAEASIQKLGCGTLTGPLELIACFTFARPKRPANPYPSLDLDKLVRAVGDALVHGKLLADDRQIVLILASKAWSESPLLLGCSITLSDAHDK